MEEKGRKTTDNDEIEDCELPRIIFTRVHILKNLS